jgi:hypothetical protein
LALATANGVIRLTSEKPLPNSHVLDKNVLPSHFVGWFWARYQHQRR